MALHISNIDLPWSKLMKCKVVRYFGNVRSAHCPILIILGDYDLTNRKYENFFESVFYCFFLAFSEQSY